MKLYGEVAVYFQAFVTLALVEGGQIQAPIALPPGKRRFGWFQRRSGCYREGENLSLPGIESPFLGSLAQNLFSVTSDVSQHPCVVW
jgi:hypothetical protein